MKRYFSFLAASFISFIAAAQTGNTPNAAFTELHNRNMLTMGLYNCQKELIQLNLDAGTNKNWDGVITKANECLRIQPSALTLEMRGAAYAAKGDLTAAITDLTKSIQLARLDLDTIRQLMEDAGGEAFKEHFDNSKQSLTTTYEARSDIYVRNGDRDKAQADLNSALVISPNDYSVKDKLTNLDKNLAEKQKEARITNPRNTADHVLAGNEYLKNGKYKEALVSFNKALGMETKNAEAYIGRGKANAQLETDQAKAIADYNTAIILSPKLAKAYSSRAYAYNKKKDWDAAIADFSMAMKQSSATAELLNARGIAYIGKENYTEALTDFTTALPMAAGNKYELITALSGQGDAYKKTGHATEAMEAYNKAVTAGKNDYIGNIFLLETYVSRAELFVAKGMKSQADADLKSALKIDPEHARAKAVLVNLNTNAGTASSPGAKTANDWTLLGRKQFQSREYEAAITSFTNGIGLEPTAYHYSLRGFAQASKGDMAAFKSDFEKAIKIDPKDKATYFMRGVVYGGKGMKTEAAADFRKVLELDPANENAKAKLKSLGVE